MEEKDAQLKKVNVLLETMATETEKLKQHNMQKTLNSPQQQKTLNSPQQQKTIDDLRLQVKTMMKQAVDNRQKTQKEHEAVVAKKNQEIQELQSRLQKAGSTERVEQLERELKEVKKVNGLDSVIKLEAKNNYLDSLILEHQKEFKEKEDAL